MKAIYEPSGRAREYAALACNLFRGCAHGCRYPCYAPGALRMKPEDFARVGHRPGIVEALVKEAPVYSGSADAVLLCFSCDPYPELDEEGFGGLDQAAPLLDCCGTARVTRQALKALIAHDVPVTVLTKAGTRACVDFDLLAEYPCRCSFGTSLSWWVDLKRQCWEPGAAPVLDRIKAIRQAKDAGIRTWVSVEPVVEPREAMAVIAHMGKEGIVDHWKVGKWNHAAEAAEIDWRRFHGEVTGLLEDLGADYMLKHDLLVAAGVDGPMLRAQGIPGVT